MIREMQIKSTFYNEDGHYRKEKAEVCEDVEKLKLFIYCLWGCKMVQMLQKMT